MPLGSWWDEHPDLLAGANFGSAEATGGPGMGAGGPAQPTGQPGAELASPMSPEGQPQAFNPNQQVGHEGSLNGMNREQYRDAWMSSGVSNPDQAKAWLAKNGGTWQADNGTALTPYGESMDMLFNARGSAQSGSGGKPIWGGGGGPGPGAGGANPPGGVFASGGGGGGYGGYGGGGGGGAAGGWDGQKFAADRLAMPTAYTPQAVQAQQATQGAPVTAQQVQGPQALTAQQLAQMPAFAGVTAADMAADPGVQFRQQQGMNTLANKFAASGLRGAGQGRAFADYNQNLASQEYGNVYARKQGEQQNAFSQAFQTTGANNAANAQAYGLTNQYQQGAQVANQGAALQAGMFNSGQQQQNSQFNAGQGNALGQFNAGRQDAAAQNNFANAFAVGQANNANAQAAWQGNTNAQLGQGSLNNQATANSNQYSLGMANVGLGYHQADQSYALGQGNLSLGYQNSNNANSLGWANYGLNAQGQDFNQQYSLSDMGLRAASQYGNYAGQYGANAQNNAIGSGNAQAAGQIGSGNAWQSAFGGIAQGALGAAGTYAGYRRPPAQQGGYP